MEPATALALSSTSAAAEGQSLVQSHAAGTGAGPGAAARSDWRWSRCRSCGFLLSGLWLTPARTRALVGAPALELVLGLCRSPLFPEAWRALSVGCKLALALKRALEPSVQLAF